MTMRVLMIGGGNDKVVTVSASYGRRLVEQGKAVLAQPQATARKPDKPEKPERRDVAAKTKDGE